MNKIILLGNICQDIVVRTTLTEKKVVSNSIAVRNDYKNENGEYDSQFFNFTAWESRADYLSKYAQKGSQILIEGRLVNSKYTEEETGKERTVTKILAERIQIVNSRKNTETDTPDVPSEPETPETDPFAEFGASIEISDDELPF